MQKTWPEPAMHASIKRLCCLILAIAEPADKSCSIREKNGAGQVFVGVETGSRLQVLE